MLFLRRKVFIYLCKDYRNGKFSPTSELNLMLNNRIVLLTNTNEDCILEL